MIKNKILSLLVLMWIVLTTEAQIISNLNQSMYDAKVKLVDEFFSRFNGTEMRKDIPCNEESQKKNLLMLLNLANYKSKNDVGLVIADSMIQKVMEKDIKLHYEDSLWLADVRCQGKYKDKVVYFHLYLTVEHRNKDMYKWVVQKAEGSLFELTPKVKDERIILRPDDHETRFTSLHRVTTDYQECVLNFADRHYEVDPTTVFYTMVQTGVLKIDFVDDVKLIFLQVPNYAFYIRYFERENNNSGWLIDNISKMNDNEKKLYLNKIHRRS